MNIIVTGAYGFIGSHLCFHLEKLEDINITRIGSKQNILDYQDDFKKADWIIHLAGSNRPEDPNDYLKINSKYTETLVNFVEKLNPDVKILFTSSVHAESDTEYGKSKLLGEKILEESSLESYVTRLPNIFGPGCKPNYNSAVATFCHNVCNRIPVKINDPNAKVNLIYIDDLVDLILKFIQTNHSKNFLEALDKNVHSISVIDLLEKIKIFNEQRLSLHIPKSGKGFIRQLYSTYISYLNKSNFSYGIEDYSDERGQFSEFVKTQDNGQFSFFTAKPGISRGNHFHFTKTEKFLVLKGQAEFNFKHIFSNEKYTLKVSDDSLKVVDSIPLWSHNIVNVGDTDLIVMLWSSEIFDKDNPDTSSYEVG